MVASGSPDRTCRMVRKTLKRFTVLQLFQRITVQGADKNLARIKILQDPACSTVLGLSYASVSTGLSFFFFTALIER